ncbi:hypothetical protein C3941_09525 [Kaistia algarum]|uniref:hypothetical protein n=1 Tax=Kaistia algarum TaxID=2083279 RepID=UPI000CE85DD8|nr:hypothetical protein [Kaistia algarum]MCX5512298.1 hypothetical protein [Kaistia algarum]PPE80388.1 hypothetical protein C3941_09525 [Kaistia algarum]
MATHTEHVDALAMIVATMDRSTFRRQLDAVRFNLTVTLELMQVTFELREAAALVDITTKELAAQIDAEPQRASYTEHSAQVAFARSKAVDAVERFGKALDEATPTDKSRILGLY